MKLGIVSNCWKILLDGGAPLEELIARASELGYRVIELRQGALGAFEDASGHPLPELLSQLPQQFGEVQFNLAVEMPFLDPAAKVDPVRWVDAIAGAQALSGRFPPHLRLVDLTTAPDRFEEIATEDLAASLILWAEELTEANGFLSVEHAREPWKLLHGALSHARRKRPDLAPRLKLCYDPVNFLLTDEMPDPTSVTHSLTADELSMIHFKQRNSGTPLPTVTEGEIDWTAQAAAIRSLDYNGPGLFEIAPHEDIWNHLEESRRYLVGCGMDMDH